MCGIVGYIGREQAAPILLEGLSRLEYRGYDSAGAAVFDAQAGTLSVHKAKGQLQVLSDQLHGGADLDSAVGVGHTRQVGYMEDGELAVLTREGIQCYNHLMQPIDKEIVTVDWAIDAVEKGGYERFMFKEIMERPEALRRRLSPRIREGEIVFEDFSLSDGYIKSMNRIYIVACGSSYHVGMVGKYHLERLTRIPVEVALWLGKRLGAVSEEDFQAMLAAFRELPDKMEQVLALTVEPHREEMAQTADGVMTIPDVHELLLLTLGVVPLQLFAYYVALMRGCDIDKPRNLAKSVTVE